jgi:CRP-like cAMP-binding protein
MISPETLRFFPLFSGQDFYMLKEIALLAQEMELAEGEWLFRERQDATKLYLVRDGAISLCVYLHLNGCGQHLETMSPVGRGEIVGWSALVKPYEYTLGARAVRNSRLIAIEAAPLRQLLDDNPLFGYHMLKKLAEAMGERLLFKCIQLLSLVVDARRKPVSLVA